MTDHFTVDWILCDGYGLCGDLVPDLIDLDGAAVARRNEEDVGMHAADDARARSAGTARVD